MIPQSFANKAPQEVASVLLTKNNAMQRAAEVEAWNYAYKYPNDSQEHRFFVEVVRFVVFGGEYPAVERSKVPQSPAGILAA